MAPSALLPRPLSHLPCPSGERYKAGRGATMAGKPRRAAAALLTSCPWGKSAGSGCRARGWIAWCCRQEERRRAKAKAKPAEAERGEGRRRAGTPAGWAGEAGAIRPPGSSACLFPAVVVRSWRCSDLGPGRHLNAPLEPGGRWAHAGEGSRLPAPPQSGWAGQGRAQGAVPAHPPARASSAQPQRGPPGGESHARR